MIELSTIKEYVKQTAVIIASVIDIDVLITGKDYLLSASLGTKALPSQRYRVVRQDKGVKGRG